MGWTVRGRSLGGVDVRGGELEWGFAEACVRRVDSGPHERLELRRRNGLSVKEFGVDGGELGERRTSERFESERHCLKFGSFECLTRMQFS